MSFHLVSGRVVSIENLCVIEAEQESGVGKLLMDEVFEYCKQNSIKEIKLGVFNDNKKAYKFYENLGFKPLEQRMNLYLD